MKKLILLITIAAFFSSCAKKDKIAGVEKPDLKNRSNAPAFIEMFPEFSAVKAYTLLSSGDTPGFCTNTCPGWIVTCDVSIADLRFWNTG